MQHTDWFMFRNLRTSSRVWVLATLLLALVGIARIASTYPVLTQTIDEANHLSHGMEWLAKGTYNTEVHHPPLRAVYSVIPYLMGVRPTEDHLPHVDGTRMLYENGDYFATLGAARSGSLPFFVLMCVALAAITKRYFGGTVAILAVAMASSAPILLAHAGLITNDFLLAATFLAAFAAWLRWLELPTLKASLILGATVGLAVLAKLSAIMFIPVVFFATAILRWALPQMPSFIGQAQAKFQPAGRINGFSTLVGRIFIALLIVALVVWAGYRFSIGALVTPDMRPYEAIDRTALGQISWIKAIIYGVVEMPVPAPEFFRGILSVLGHGTGGTHLTYFMGEVRPGGWPLFFPVGIVIKSTIPFILLWFVGLMVAFNATRRSRSWLSAAPEVAALAILAVCIPASLNIGIRHILLIFPLMAITSARGAYFLALNLRKWAAGWVIVSLLLGWHALASIKSHPDYLGYFNECCQTSPERYLVGSDLDWGQDLQRLSDELRRRKVDDLHLSYSGFADPEKHGLPPHQTLEPGVPVKGWVAISVQRKIFGTKEPPYDQYRWLSAFVPVTRVGSSIDLYFIE